MKIVRILKVMAYVLVALMVAKVASADVNTLVIGKVSPEQSNKEYQNLKQRVEVLAKEMKEEGIEKTDVFLAKTIKQMIAAIKAGKVNWVSDDLLTTLILSNATRAEVILGEKGNAERYSSVFFVNKKSNISSIENIEKKIVIFESTKTGSGYFIPFYELTKHAYTPKQYAKTDTSISAGKQRIFYRFEKNKENLVKAVKENMLNIGVMSYQDYQRLGDNVRGGLKVIHETVNYPSTLELITPDQDLTIKNKLQKLLRLSDTAKTKKVKSELANERRFEQFLADGKDGYVFFKNILKHKTVPLNFDDEIKIEKPKQ